MPVAIVVAVPAGGVQRGVAIAARLVDGGVGVDQQLSAVAMAVGAGDEQRCVAIAAWLVESGVGVEQ